MVGTSMSWVSYETLKSVSAILGLLAGLVTAIGVLHRQVISPWIAKPIAKGVKNELTDYMEVILFSEPMVTQLREIVQEEIVKGNKSVINLLRQHDRRLRHLEEQTDQIHEATTGSGDGT